MTDPTRIAIARPRDPGFSNSGVSGLSDSGHPVEGRRRTGSGVGV